ncbi:hypothetical protein PVAND_013433 [Polypedilum vanderplanki]|uniref:Uncharacterized protein n=1 Tax=Polypedilum vanderplanki TaxID=319348 RepID=A0A9J6CPG2_POLVA|nr:hypothetical protein PVAND_013433 [Polypedilum vanderplanki]
MNCFKPPNQSKVSSCQSCVPTYQCIQTCPTTCNPCSEVCPTDPCCRTHPPTNLYIDQGNSCEQDIFETPMCNKNIIITGSSRCEKMFCKNGRCCKCRLIRCETEVPCKPCYIVRCAPQSASDFPSHKIKKGEPKCGCIYGCPCKAACYNWNPCIRPFNN